MFLLYTAGSVPLYLSLPYFAGDPSHSMTSLLGFYGSSLLLMSFFGGAYRCDGEGGRLSFGFKAWSRQRLLTLL